MAIASNGATWYGTFRSWTTGDSRNGDFDSIWLVLRHKRSDDDSTNKRRHDTSTVANGQSITSYVPITMLSLLEGSWLPNKTRGRGLISTASTSSMQRAPSGLKVKPRSCSSAGEYLPKKPSSTTRASRYLAVPLLDGGRHECVGKFVTTVSRRNVEPCGGMFCPRRQCPCPRVPLRSGLQVQPRSQHPRERRVQGSLDRVSAVGSLHHRVVVRGQCRPAVGLTLHVTTESQIMFPSNVVRWGGAAARVIPTIFRSCLFLVTQKSRTLKFSGHVQGTCYWSTRY